MRKEERKMTRGKKRSEEDEETIRSMNVGRNRRVVLNL